MSMLIRVAAAGDLDAIEEMERASARNPWKRGQRAEELALPYAHFLVAVRGGELAGLLDIHVIAGDAHINDVLVDVRHRGNGVAAALLRRGLELAAAADCAAVSLEVRVHNEPALRLYQSAGFEIVGVKKNFYVNPPDDAYIMIKTLP